MIRGSFLLVDDEPKIRTALAEALKAEGHDVAATGSPREALRWLGDRPFDVLVVDNLMPELSGLETIREIVASVPAADRPAILMMTAHATVESAIEAMKLGALDYLQKPFDIDEFLIVATRAVEHARLRTQRDYLITERDERFDHYGILGDSRAIRDVIARAQQVAQSRSTVLITGETGTGKELVARAIHAWSAQAEMPLVRVNCAALPDTLIESELFGHVRGAFTGAVGNKKGRFALADGGTIFLDEIGTVALSVQAKLLRVLQEREFEPLGSEQTIHVDVRVIAATNRDLAQLVTEGKFQQDLYYRLNVIPIALPPLRDRREDIPILVNGFIKRHASRAGKRVDGIDAEAMRALVGASWPGNVRELENTVERAVVLARRPVITAGDVTLVGAAIAPASVLPGLNLKQNLEWTERETVRQALAASRGVKKDAAEAMGISQRAMSYYLAKHRLGDDPA
ncbi:MAG TPA: sigma-54 dependent transcriptional regulator [Vicinamibacterales bacterium]|nr:sigma-54 dependent transcriptional regulator [Vicinamibacterales bacterium]